jgi:hypothetical protein
VKCRENRENGSRVERGAITRLKSLFPPFKIINYAEKEAVDGENGLNRI